MPSMSLRYKTSSKSAFDFSRPHSNLKVLYIHYSDKFKINFSASDDGF